MGAVAPIGVGRNCFGEIMEVNMELISSQLNRDDVAFYV